MIHAAPQGTGAALQDKLHCFLHRHEIALDVLMRDGERTVAAELPLEEGNERAARPQHIAEPHRHETSAAVPSRAVKIERRSEEHTSELQSLMRISSAVFCLKKKK